jgi:hypothetical protein
VVDTAEVDVLGAEATLFVPAAPPRCARFLDQSPQSAVEEVQFLLIHPTHGTAAAGPVPVLARVLLAEAEAEEVIAVTISGTVVQGPGLETDVLLEN